MTRRLRLALIIIVSIASTVTAEANLGFNSIAFVFDESRWKEFTRDKPPDFAEENALDLQSPKQVIFVYNAWHLPGLMKDIRIQDLEKHVLRPRLMFEDKWPRYSHPGYVAMVETSSGEWALITEMAQRHIIEYRSRIRVISRGTP